MGIEQESGYLIGQKIEKELFKKNKNKQRLGKIESIFNNESLAKIKASNVVYPKYLFNKSMLNQLFSYF